MTNPQIAYNNIFAADYAVTGIRRDSGKDAPVLISGTYETGSSKQPQGLLYRGSFSQQTVLDTFVWRLPSLGKR
ncbi:MAG: hypothetical protein ABSG51_08400 [Terracidiphilus sp.]|jgi:hypothetical protein